MTEINKLTPSYAGITYAKLDKGGVQWPCPTVEHPGTPILHTTQFSRGKGRFAVIATGRQSCRTPSIRSC